MNKLGLTLLATLACAAGCSKGSGDNSSNKSAESSDIKIDDSSECGKSINSAMATMSATRKADLETKTGMPNLAPGLKEKMEKGAERAEKAQASLKPVLYERCTEDKWSADTLDCFSKAGKREELAKCMNGMPKDQQDKLTESLKSTQFGGLKMRPLRPNPNGGSNGMMMGSHPTLQGLKPRTGSGAETGSGTGSGSAGSAAPTTGSATGSATPATGSGASTGSAAKGSAATPTPTPVQTPVPKPG